jgi:hypothetical protein
MKDLFSHLLSLALVAALLFVSAGAGFCEEKPLLFTNDDIEKYRQPSDNKPQEQKPQQQQKKTVPSAKKDEDKKNQGKQGQEYWCKRTTAAMRKIEKAAQDVREREEEISREQSKNGHTSRKKNTTLQGKLKKAKDHLSSAERDLSDIEHEAHRKSIPPGWLRCQFD